MGKPFSLQSPKQIAKEYGGNIEKIRQAAQMRLVDPTAAVLAGMFINRLRAAQSLEQGAQPTVAQQVLAPPAPASAPAAPPASGAAKFFGAPASAPAAPPASGAAKFFGAPPPMAPQAPPMGMASGGLTTLPIPDNMFDEPQYGGGGIVAFSGKDGSGLVESELMRLARIVSDPDASPEARNAAQKDLVSRRPPEASTPLGRFGSSIYDYLYQTPEESALGAARMERPDLLRKQADELSAASTLVSTISSADRANNLEKAGRLRAEANAIERGEPTSTTPAPDSGAIYTGGGGNAPRGHLAPPPQDAAAAAKAAAAKAAAEKAAAPKGGQPGLGGPRVDQEVAKAEADVAEAAPGVPKIDYLEELAKYRGEAPTLFAGESLADQKKQDFDMALAEMGLRTAAGTSPNALVNIGVGAAGALPGMQKAMDRRRETQRDAAKAEDARRLAIFVSKGEDFRGSTEAGQKDATLGIQRDTLKQTGEQNIAENLLRQAQINAQSSTESERMFAKIDAMKPGPERDQYIADWEAIKGAGAIQYNPLKAQTQTQLDIAQKTIDTLQETKRVVGSLTATQQEALNAAMLRVYGAKAAAPAADRIRLDANGNIL